MSHRDVSMVCRCFVMASLMMFRGLLMMTRGMDKVF
jgi:hypothetical protein